MLITISVSSIINAFAVVFLVALGVYVGRLATSPVTGINFKRFTCFVKKLWGRVDFIRWSFGNHVKLVKLGGKTYPVKKGMVLVKEGVT